MYNGTLSRIATRAPHPSHDLVRDIINSNVIYGENKWVTCPTCGHSCTGVYAGVVTCLRCIQRGSLLGRLSAHVGAVSSSALVLKKLRSVDQ